MHNWILSVSVSNNIILYFTPPNFLFFLNEIGANIDGIRIACFWQPHTRIFRGASELQQHAPLNPAPHRFIPNELVPSEAIDHWINFRRFLATKVSPCIPSDQDNPRKLRHEKQKKRIAVREAIRAFKGVYIILQQRAFLY